MMWSGCWYLVMGWCCLLHRGHADLFHEDGVLVMSKGEVRTVSAVWQLVVLIAPPDRPPVETWFSQVRDHVGKLTASRWFDNIHHWNMKLDVLKARLEQDPVEVQQVVAQRPKRGLVNAVGVAASWLFGTVSQAQLEAVQSVLTSNGLQTQALKHNQEHMLSIMNRTRNIQLQLAQHVAVVDRLLSLVQEEADDMKVTSNDIALLLKIRIAVEELESVVDDYVSKRALHHRMVMEVGRGRLTELLLGRAQLAGVLKVAQNAGFGGLGLHWYYENARIDAVWGPDASIAFRLGLQMVSQDTFSAYELTYLPVPLDTEHLRTVVGEHIVAVGTRRKSSFYPQACMGNEPIVCYPTMEMTYQSCEAALVTGMRPENCRLRITKVRGSVSATVVEPVQGMGSVIIAPHEPHIGIVIRCAGKPQVNKKVVGPTMMSVAEACVVEGRGWLLQTLTVKHETLRRQQAEPRLVLPAVNITWPKVLHHDMREQLQRLPELQVPLMSLDGLVQIPAGYVRTEDRNILWYSCGTVAGIVLIICTMYLYFRCQARCRRQKGGRCKLKRGREAAVYDVSDLPPPSPPLIQKDTIVRYKAKGSVLELPEVPYNV